MSPFLLLWERSSSCIASVALTLEMSVISQQSVRHLRSRQRTTSALRIDLGQAALQCMLPKQLKIGYRLIDHVDHGCFSFFVRSIFGFGLFSFVISFCERDAS